MVDMEKYWENNIKDYYDHRDVGWKADAAMKKTGFQTY